MPNYTPKYQLGYFLEGETTLGTTELQRWESVDAQLNAVFSILGNGVLEGWNIIPGTGLNIAVTPGKGHVAFVAVQSNTNVTIENITPSATNYIYAQLTEDSYWTKNVRFSAYVSPIQDNGRSLLLGKIDADVASVIPSTLDTDDRSELGFVGLIKEAIKDHRHIGGTNNPPPINLSSEVQGTLSQENIPELDASLVTTGELPLSVIPNLSHIDNLTDQGSLTHAQLESILDSLSSQSNGTIGEVALVNLLQLILALKHIYPDIDDYLVNEIAIIPGITPDEYIDFTNTTADVDTRTYAEGGEHTIKSTETTEIKSYTKSWLRKEDYNSFEKSDIFIDGNSITISTEEDILAVDRFENADSWTISTEDNSSIDSKLSLDSNNYIGEPYSGLVEINGETVEMIFLAKREIIPQNWSGYDYLKFYIKTSDLQHGDLLFYISDSKYGIQNSYTKILDRNRLTINESTLENGWQEVIVDIRNYERQSIDKFAFMMSTQDGWDSSKNFSFNIDEIYLTSGNKYKDSGRIRMQYGNNYPYEFDKIRLDYINYDDSIVKARYRFSNTIIGLESAQWSEYFTFTNGEIEIYDDTYYKYIQFDILLESSSDLESAPYIQKVYLDFSTSGIEDSVEISNWDEGYLFNMESDNGSLKNSQISDINNVYYGTEKGVGKLNSDYNMIQKIVGSTLPKTTNQVLNGEQSSFGLITAVERGNNGNLWICDTDNDRVIEIDQSGHLSKGFYGSFLNPPSDEYGIEDNGVGSNVYSVDFIPPAIESSDDDIQYNMKILHALYNDSIGRLYIVFNKNIENIYDEETTFDINKMKLKINNHMFYLAGSDVSLYNVEKEKYFLWYDSYIKSPDDESKGEFYKHLRQFNFHSHILQVDLPMSEKTAISYILNEKNPRVVIVSPSGNERITDSSTTVKLLFYDFVPGNTIGEPSIRLTIDGLSQIIYSNSFELAGISPGEHTLKVELLDENGNIYGNIGSVASTTFVRQSQSYIYPVLSIDSPKSNQIFSTSSVILEFSVENYPIIPSGQHVIYELDGKAKTSIYSTEPITISNLASGEHTVRMYLVDENLNQVNYTHSEAKISFIVGLNPNATMKLFTEKDLLQDLSKKTSIIKSTTEVDIGNIVFSNIYSPIDIDLVPYSTVNGDEIEESENIVIAKLRSPSSNKYLGGSANTTEIAARTVNDGAAITEKVPQDPIFEGISSDRLIYGSYYMDGHSVVQFDVYGNVVLSNNAAVFATTKPQAKEILGSVQKFNTNQFLIGDSYNRRAIITTTDLQKQESKIVWEYKSDKYIPDFNISDESEIEISVLNGSISETYSYVNQNGYVVWKNNSSSPIYIYSGSINGISLLEYKDLAQYGNDFKSEQIQPGESFTHTFNTTGNYDWFVYPYLLTGKINVSKQMLSPRDRFYLIESDGLESPYTSRVLKIDTWGNVIWSFGEGYLIQPRDIRQSKNKVLIST